MYRRNLAAVGLWCAVTFSMNVIAKDIAIYRWLDENNVVHYSQQQPQNVDYTQLTTVSSFQAKEKVPPGTTNKPTLDEQMSQYEKEKAEVFAKNAEIAKKNCKAAQLNQQMLNSFDKVMMTDADGTNRAMSDKEKKAQLVITKKQISMYCTTDSNDNN
jgi:hypothetical protein